MGKPILCVDFDGVIHSYTNGWQGADVVTDPPVDGALNWLWWATEWFEVQIYSSRTGQTGGIDAMQAWLERHAEEEFGKENTKRFMDAMIFPLVKPAAFLTIDDRAICFQGDWSALVPAELVKFKPWNKR
jgi:hypothetical protein